MESKDITVHDASQLGYDVANLEHLGTARDGGIWFKLKAQNVAIRCEWQEDGSLREAETKPLTIGKTMKKPSTTTVECKDCGSERVVKVQDAFQVKRCKECQKRLRNKKRADRAKIRREERRKEKAVEKLENTTTE